MYLMKTTGFVLVVIIGMALVVSCADDSPGSADASNCSCPAAEPPLAGRVKFVTESGVVQPDSSTAARSAICPEGALVLGGGCENLPKGNIRNVTLRLSAPLVRDNGAIDGWTCVYFNNEAEPVEIQTSVACLMPAS